MGPKCYCCASFHCSFHLSSITSKNVSSNTTPTTEGTHLIIVSMIFLVRLVPCAETSAPPEPPEPAPVPLPAPNMMDTAPGPYTQDLYLAKISHISLYKKSTSLLADNNKYDPLRKSGIIYTREYCLPPKNTTLNRWCLLSYHCRISRKTVPCYLFGIILDSD